MTFFDESGTSSDFGCRKGRAVPLLNMIVGSQTDPGRGSQPTGCDLRS